MNKLIKGFSRLYKLQLATSHRYPELRSTRESRFKVASTVTQMSRGSYIYIIYVGQDIQRVELSRS